jgi:4-oxalocrotonate tautomerase
LQLRVGGFTIARLQSEKSPMSIIACDMRVGRTDEQKRELAAGLIAAVMKATGEPLSNMVFVVREGRGINFCEAGLHYPDYVAGNKDDAALIEHVKAASERRS